MEKQKSSIVDFLSEDVSIQALRRTLDVKKTLAVYGLGEGQRTLISAALLAGQEARDLLVLCDTQKRAKELWEDLNSLLGAYEVLYFPALEMIPYELLAKSGELEQKRSEVLAKLLAPQRRMPFAIITTVEGLSKELIPPAVFQEGLRTLQVGEIIEPEALKDFLVTFGYEVVEQVEQQGQLAFRGGIMDVFPPCAEHAVRIEFFDDEVDSLRYFDVSDQLSIQKVQTVELSPAREFFLTEERIAKGSAAIREAFEVQLERLAKKKDRAPVERLQGKVGEVLEKVREHLYFAGLEQFQRFFYPDGATLLDYMDKNTLVIVDEANRLQEAQAHLERERQQSFTGLLMNGSVLPGQETYFRTMEELAEAISTHRSIIYSLMPKKSVFLEPDQQFHTLECKSIPPILGKIELLVEELKNWVKQRYAVLILLPSEEKAARLLQLLEDNEMKASWIADRYQADSGQIYLALGSLNQGAQFIYSRLVIITENEIFQNHKKRTTKKMFHEDGQRITHLDDLKIGDYVVHMSHGIGQYLGIERLKTENIERDYLVVKYADDAKVYVPVDRFELLQKYVVEEGKIPKINKLGGPEWQKTKMKVKASVEHMAEQLLEIYARRQSQPGFAFSPDDELQRQFEEAFPYVETQDQLKAINDVKTDMMKPMVMDRLVCGDVGYGKTEVAIRAAFKAVNDGKQVAVLVPTTVLAQQHYNTFKERFSPYGVNVGMLSRFCTAKEQKATMEELKAGLVDIIIGTHKLLNKSVKYKDLGLLVIDEEQRFGVTHKGKNQGDAFSGGCPDAFRYAYSQNAAYVLSRDTRYEHYRNAAAGSLSHSNLYC